jgi:hypothetical protein
VGKCGGAREATDDIIRRMRFACWVSKATLTHPRAHSHKYVIVIAFPQQWLRDSALISRYKYIACFVARCFPHQNSIYTSHVAY